VVGRTIYVNRYPLTIVGVVPAKFFGTKPGLAFEIWVPLMMTPQLTGSADGELNQGSREYWTIARLKPGVTVVQARGEVEALVKRLTEVNTQQDEGLTATVVPVWKSHTGGQSILLAPLGILMAVCFVVLLIVCSNVSNLLLARSVVRHRERTKARPQACAKPRGRALRLQVGVLGVVRFTQPERVELDLDAEGASERELERGHERTAPTELVLLVATDRARSSGGHVKPERFDGACHRTREESRGQSRETRGKSDTHEAVPSLATAHN
jgi:hypothetical protein